MKKEKSIIFPVLSFLAIFVVIMNIIVFGGASTKYPETSNEKTEEPKVETTESKKRNNVINVAVDDYSIKGNTDSTKLVPTGKTYKTKKTKATSSNKEKLSKSKEASKKELPDTEDLSEEELSETEDVDVWTAQYSEGNRYAYGWPTWYAWSQRRDLPSNMGNARNWVNAARRAGFPVDNEPHEGDVFQTAYGGGGYGHVGYVTGINADGSIRICDMNGVAGWGRVGCATWPRAKANEYNYIHYKPEGWIKMALEKYSLDSVYITEKLITIREGMTVEEDDRSANFCVSEQCKNAEFEQAVLRGQKTFIDDVLSLINEKNNEYLALSEVPSNINKLQALIKDYRDRIIDIEAQIEEQKELQEAEIALAIRNYNSSGIIDSGINTYPKKNNCPQDNLRYSFYGGYVCQNVSYAGWKVYERYNIRISAWGNANQWHNTARRLGYTVDHVPEAGSVAITTGGPYGHAMWVEKVNDNGTINLSEYNNSYSSASGRAGDFGYRRNVPTGGMWFIHFTNHSTI